MRHIIHRHKIAWTDKAFFASALDGALFLAASLIVNYNAGTYATEKASNAVNDLFLDNLPMMNVNVIFIQGFILFVLFIVLLIAHHPKRIPFVLKSMALFIITRAIFMTLTHIGPYPEQSPLVTGDIIQKFIFGGDLFFSGHAGLSFLMVLIFWQSFRLRMAFIAISMIFSASALLGHLHYSIDVFAAYFITYGIFKIAQRIFAKDYDQLLAVDSASAGEKVINRGLIFEKHKEYPL